MCVRAYVRACASVCVPCKMPRSRPPSSMSRARAAPTLRRRIHDDMNEFLTPEFEAAFEKLKCSLAHCEDCADPSDDAPQSEDVITRTITATTTTSTIDRESENRNVATRANTNNTNAVEQMCGAPNLCVYCGTVAELGVRLLFALRALQLFLFAIRVIAGCRWKWLEWFVGTSLILGFFVEESLRLIKFGWGAYYASIWNRLYAALWSSNARLLVGLVAVIVTKNHSG